MSVKCTVDIVVESFFFLMFLFLNVFQIKALKTKKGE